MLTGMLTGMAKREVAIQEERVRLASIREGWNDLYLHEGQQDADTAYHDLFSVCIYWSQSSNKLEQEHWTAVYNMIEEYTLDKGWKAP